MSTLVRRVLTAFTDTTISTLLPDPGVPGITHRWIASQIEETTGTINTWADSVGSVALVGNGVVKTTDGIKRIRFNETGGLNQFMQATGIAQADINTITFLARVYATGTQGILGAGGGYVTRGGGFATFNYGGPTGNRVSTVDPMPKFVPITMIGKTGDVRWYVGADTGTITDGTGVNTIVRPGYSSGSSYGNVEFTEIMTWGRALTAGEVATAHADLTARYPTLTA